MTGGRPITVLQGEVVVSAEGHAVLSTVLGSCVAVCLHDPVAQVGGMNHFLLPGDPGQDGGARYGVHLMELLINGMLKKGASRSRMTAKIFGGARMSDTLRDIGGSNLKFAREFLEREEIPLLSESGGGRNARRVRFLPVSGIAQQMLVPAEQAEPARISAPPRLTPADIELF